jgi:hypothetical protein
MNEAIPILIQLLYNRIQNIHITFAKGGVAIED